MALIIPCLPISIYYLLETLWYNHCRTLLTEVSAKCLYEYYDWPIEEYIRDYQWFI